LKTIRRSAALRFSALSLLAAISLTGNPVTASEPGSDVQRQPRELLSGMRQAKELLSGGGCPCKDAQPGAAIRADSDVRFNATVTSWYRPRVLS
jgi:hypothetical protein